MTEVWLRSNRRALGLGLVIPAVILIAGVWLLAVAVLQHLWVGWTVIGAVVVLFGLGLAAQIIRWMLLPRLAYDGEHLLVYLDAARPTRVPLDVVECFFQGQGGSQLPKLEGAEPETTNVIVRLAESATEWKHRDVRPTLGHWCEGYITLNGAWCEPLQGEALKQLNQRLITAQRVRRQQAAAATGQSL